MLLIVLAGLLALAFFASGEIAIMALDPLAAETEARKGSRSAKILQRLRSKPQRLLTTMLIGNNLASMGLAAWFTGWCISYLVEARQLVSTAQATMIAAVAMTVLQTVFGELLPKTVAAVSGIRLARLLAVPAAFFQTVLSPFSWLLEVALLPLVNRLSGGKNAMETSVSRAELSTALVLAQKGGELHSIDAQVAREALDFSSTDLREVMTPRVDVAAVPDTTLIGAALELMSQRGFSRLPVFHEDIDEVIGVVLMKDLVRHATKVGTQGKDPLDSWAVESLLPMMRQILFFPDSKSIVDALRELQAASSHMAVVVDEHGGTAGIVTLEDILEELVGDITDEFDSAQNVDILRRTDEYAIVSSRARVDQLPELEGLELEDVEASTIGGLLMERLGRGVRVGDELLLEGNEMNPGVKITALKVQGNRIKLLKLERVSNAAQEEQ
ncbi:HlyC/CorC family transporter [bacterium]|nr:HlyC/CorC family transporter [bacterium]